MSNTLPKKIIENLCSNNKNKVISGLKELRNNVSGTQEKHVIDGKHFNLIASFLKEPNQKLLSYAISILANYCVHENYRRLFKSTDGVSDLRVILSSLDNQDILCRAWRLVANLAKSSDLCEKFIEFKFHDIISDHMKEWKGTEETNSMIIRAIEKICCYRRCIQKLAKENFFILPLVQFTSQQSENYKNNLLLPFLKVFYQISCADHDFKIDQDFIIRLVQLTKEEQFYEAAIDCLFMFIKNNPYPKFLENTGVVDVIISHFSEKKEFKFVQLELFSVICCESAVRNRIKNEGLLIKLTSYCKVGYIRLMLKVFSYFLYDVDSIKILAGIPEFISTLVNNISEPKAVPLLVAIIEYGPDNQFFVKKRNLSIFASAPECHKLILSILKKVNYLQSIILSGVAWVLFEPGLYLYNERSVVIESLRFAEGVLDHCVLKGTDEQKKTALLAAPFLITWSFLYKYLEEYGGLDIIVERLANNSDDAIAAVVKLTEMFRASSKISHCSKTASIDSGYHSYSFTTASSSSTTSSPTSSSSRLDHKPKHAMNMTLDGNLEEVMVTFMLDDGECVAVPKRLFSAHSPVFDSMLNGSFVEAKQDCIKFRECSSGALAMLINLLQDYDCILDINVHLELIALTDRLLIMDLHEELLECLKVTDEIAGTVFLWASRAGYAPYATTLRDRFFWSILSSRNTLKAALSTDLCRILLIDDIKRFLMTSLTSLPNYSKRKAQKRPWVSPDTVVEKEKS